MSRKSNEKFIEVRDKLIDRISQSVNLAIVVSEKKNSGAIAYSIYKGLKKRHPHITIISTNTIKNLPEDEYKELINSFDLAICFDIKHDDPPITYAALDLQNAGAYTIMVSWKLREFYSAFDWVIQARLPGVFKEVIKGLKVENNLKIDCTLIGIDETSKSYHKEAEA